MYPAYIGKRFLTLYNERQGTTYTARQFFDKVIFPLFFDAEKHFINVSGSSFFQAVTDKQLKESGLTKSQFQVRRLHNTIATQSPNGSTLVGFSAGEVDGKTSGQVSTLHLPTDENTIYASWIGAGFGISMGEFSCYSIEPDILWSIFNGWQDYRKILNQSFFKGNQVETWNALWLCHVYRRDYVSGEKFIPSSKEIKSEKEGIQKVQIGMEGKNWQELVFTLARKFSSIGQLIVNVYFFEKSNKTVGFIPIHLPEVRRLFEVRDFIFGKIEVPIEKQNELDTLYKVEFSFGRACREGAIRLRSLEPKDLSKYLRPDKSPKSLSNFNDFINYQTWIIAMLNNNELYDLSVKVARTLIEFEAGNIRDNTRKKKVKEFLEATNRKTFNNCATEIIKEEPAFCDMFNELVKNAHFLPADSLPLFNSLIRFQYFYQQGKSKSTN